MILVHGKVKIREKTVKDYKYYEAIIQITKNEEAIKLKYLDGKKVHVLIID